MMTVLVNARIKCHWNCKIVHANWDVKLRTVKLLLLLLFLKVFLFFGLHDVWQDKENYEGNNRSEKNQLAEDEEKEQSSPVSVLDPPFDNEEEGRESGEEEDYDVECSFAMVQSMWKQSFHFTKCTL